MFFEKLKLVLLIHGIFFMHLNPFLTEKMQSEYVYCIVLYIMSENVYLIHIAIFKLIAHIKFWSYGPLIIVITI